MVVVVVVVVNACFYCVRFCFSVPVPSQGIGLGNVSEMTCFVLSGTKNLNSVNEPHGIRYGRVSGCHKPLSYRNGSVGRAA